jgi:uncharacterized OB-fold protein
MSAKKIIDALNEAIAGKIGRATVYRGGVPILRYTECHDCGNVTGTERGRCDTCGARKIAIVADGQSKD